MKINLKGLIRALLACDFKWFTHARIFSERVSNVRVSYLDSCLGRSEYKNK